MTDIEALKLLKVKNFFERFLCLNERKSQLAGTLSGGGQQIFVWFIPLPIRLIYWKLDGSVY